MAAAHGGYRLGGGAFNHDARGGAEEEYDRLRGLARQETSKRQSLSAQSQQAYQRGDGAAAHDLSQQAKQHGAQADQYNQQASEYIFRENNAQDRVDSDTIDLHGQFVEEAERIVEQRIRYAQSTGQTHLHVIVGKGIHSRDHVQKIKPKVEEICQELGLRYQTEENAGRIYVDLTGGQQAMPQTHQPSGQYHQEAAQHAYQQGGYPGNYSAGAGNQGQQQQQFDQVEEMVEKNLPRILRALRSCCTIM